MNKAELIEALADKTGLQKQEAKLLQCIALWQALELIMKISVKLSNLQPKMQAMTKSLEVMLHKLLYKFMAK